MKVVIIDDEKQAIASLQMELNGISPPIEVIGTAHSVKSGIELLQKVTPDIVFLDIQLTDGMGFDILQETDNFTRFRIVFTTAYDKYALEAFKLGAYDYLLKPIDIDELEQTISKIADENKRARFEISEAQTNSLLSLTDSLSSEKRIALSTSDGIFLKNVSSIKYIQADGSYTKVFFSDKTKTMLLSKNLKYFEKILLDSGFVRIHFSHLINLNHLESFHPKAGGYVVMSDGVLLPVSTRKKAHLLSVLKQ